VAADLLPGIDCPDPRLPPGAQGIARVAVDDARAELVVTFQRPLALPAQRYALEPRSYSLSGGRRLFPRVLGAEPYEPPDTPPELRGRRVRLALSGPGDFSIYTLTVTGPDIDPFFASRKLRFRLACDDPFDCRPRAHLPPSRPELPVTIDYLTKDYAGFRQALLDFVPTRLPEWDERSEADLGMVLLELFAATADQLSYLQDRVANEAFLDTATQRRSVAGHLALIGYELDEGAAATTWLAFRVKRVVTLPARPGVRVSNDPRRANVPGGGGEPVIVFETLVPATLRPEHNELRVHTWGNRRCCLEAGALGVALAGSYPDLAPGDHLLFDDSRGHRDVVRLSGWPTIVPPGPALSPPGGPVTLVRWTRATPLRHDYCVGGDLVVRGNLVPASHGETVQERLTVAAASGVAGRRRARLGRAPLAHLDPATSALAGLAAPPGTPPLAREPRSVSTLELDVDGERWQRRPTLVGSRPDDRVYRLEVGDRGEATLVFGDGTLGRRLPASATVTAVYRVGGGTVGNLGADTLTRPQPPGGRRFDDWLEAVTNPLPATGGRDLESRDHARRFGPPSFGEPLMAVTAADYRAAAQRFSHEGRQLIQRADAAFRWTGSWLTVTLTVDPRETEELTGELRRALVDFLDDRRLAGYDLEVRRPLFVPVEVAVEVCLAPGARDADVEEALRRALGSAELPDGRRGFFHPDNFSFGDRLSVSRLFAAIMAVPGVESARIVRLARWRSPHADQETSANLRQGHLEVGPDQIVRLDDDPNFPENGALAVRAIGVGA
jgi:hypothetical protein